MLHKTHDHTCSWGVVPMTACTCVLAGGRGVVEVNRGGQGEEAEASTDTCTDTTHGLPVTGSDHWQTP